MLRLNEKCVIQKISSWSADANILFFTIPVHKDLQTSQLYDIVQTIFQNASIFSGFLPSSAVINTFNV